MNGAGTSMERAEAEKNLSAPPQQETVACMVCRAANDPSEDRCVRCGRRLHLAAPRPAPIELQPALFREPVLGGAKIIPIPTLTPLHPEEMETRKPRARANTAPRTPRKGALQSSNQHVLEFPETASATAYITGYHIQDETIVCDAPVAPPVHRIIAAAVDCGIVLSALLLFVATFYVVGGRVAVDARTLPLLVGVTAVLSLFYRCVWCIAGGDTPGMRFAGLRLVDFDGRVPDRDQRSIRQIAGLLSVVSAGLGLIWALVDEESLTWHDRISKTFPTAS